MYLYPFSKLTGDNLSSIQGMSLPMLESASKANDAGEGQINPAKGAAKLSSFFVAPHSNIADIFIRRFVKQLNFASFSTRTRV